MPGNFLDTSGPASIIRGAIPLLWERRGRELDFHMKRYIDLRDASWAERTLSRMQEARREICLAMFGRELPCAGVIDTQPIETLEALIAAGWVRVSNAPGDMLRRKAARHGVMETLADDADCLSPQEHMLVERMLIADGSTFADTVAEMEAALTLRLRLWADVGVREGRPCVRLDESLRDALPALLMRPQHHQRRNRVFVYHGMIGGLLYLSGFLDSRMPQERFIAEVLGEKDTPQARRLARNHLEASFDMAELKGCQLLLHEALAQPEPLLEMLCAYGPAAVPGFGSGQLLGAMNGLLPEEAGLNAKLVRALCGVLRPGTSAEDVAEELRLLVKQGAAVSGVREALSEKLCVMPGRELDNLLRELCRLTPGWLSPVGTAVPSLGGAVAGVVH